MQICVRVLWHIVVEHNVHSFYIHASSKEICSDQDSFAEALEGLILCQSVGRGLKLTLPYIQVIDTDNRTQRNQDKDIADNNPTSIEVATT